MKTTSILLLLLLLISCFKEGGQAKRSDKAASAGAVPEIVSASLYPENATAATQLIAQYNLENSSAGEVTLTFRWHVNNELVQEGPAGTLDPGKHFKGTEVYVEIIPENQQGEGESFKTEMLTIGNLLPTVDSVSLQPIDPPVGETLTASAEGADPDSDSVEFFYQWFVNGKAVSELSENREFSTAGLRKKDMVHVVVTPSDGDANGEISASDVVVLGGKAPKIKSRPPTALANGIYKYQVSAADADGDKLSFSLETAPEGMTIDSSSGLISWEPPKQVSDRQEVPVKIKVEDGDGGTAYQAYSLFLEVK